MNYGDLLLGALLGAIAGLLIGVTLGSYLRPLAACIERKARRDWADPVVVSVDRDPSLIWAGNPDWVGFSVYVDDPLRFGDRYAPPGRDDWLAWARSLNAVDAVSTFVKITIQARVEAAVLVENIRVLHHRKVPLTRGMILTRGVGGPDLDPRRFEIELDWGKEAVVTWVKPGGETAKPLALKLAAGDVEQFHVWANANQGDEAVRHEWVMELQLLVEGQRVAHQIDSSGQPFVTVSPGTLPRLMNPAGTDTWEEWPA